MSSAAIIPFQKRARFAGAHADYNRADFIFLRTQSPVLRDLPWEERIKPMKSWSEIAMYSGATAFGAVLLVSLLAAGM